MQLLCIQCGAFHGTSISIFQHPSADKRGEVYESLKIREGTKTATVPELPKYIIPTTSVLHKEEPRSSTSHSPKFVFQRPWLAKAMCEK